MKIFSYIVTAIPNAFSWFFGIIGRAVYRFWYDDGFSRAAALAYTTLFALVPITALSILMYSSFGVDQEQVKNTVDKVLEQILPPTKAVQFVNLEKREKEEPVEIENKEGTQAKTVAKFGDLEVKEVQNEQLIKLRNQITDNLIDLARNARALGVLTLAALFFIGISLLNTIESALNTVWRTTSNLTILSKILSFWAVITLGPLLIALSIYWTSKAHSFGFLPIQHVEQYGIFYRFFIPVSVTTIALSLLFYKLPASTVRMRDAFLGALVAAVLFEFVKIGFSYYLSKTSGYSALYGFIATVPLFLFWLYLSWVVVIFGAEVSYLSGSLHILHELRRYSTDLGELGVVIGLRILAIIGKRFRDGQSTPTEGEIAVETGSDPVLLRACMNTLTEAHLLSSFDTETKTRNLLKSPDKIRVSDVVAAFRAKKYRGFVKELDQPIGESSVIGEDVYVLDIIRLRALAALDKRSVSDWTLQDILSCDHEIAGER